MGFVASKGIWEKIYDTHQRWRRIPRDGGSVSEKSVADYMGHTLNL